MKVEKDHPREYAAISATERTMAIIELLTGSKEGVSVTDLGEHLRINKGMVFRLLVTLESLGYVRKDELTQRYRLTTKLLGLSVRHLDTLDVYDVVLPILRKLARETGELSELYWEHQGRLILVAKAESPRRVKVVDHLGEDLVLHASAGGKAWLANLPESEALRAVLDAGMPALTANTITDIARFQKELARVRAQGFGINAQETDEDVSAVAAPVFLAAGGTRVSGAVSVVAPAYRAVHTDDRVRALTQAAAQEISSVWPFVAIDAETMAGEPGSE